MKIVELKDKSNEIYDIDCKVEKDKFTIRWKWPQSIDIVYILKTEKVDDFSLDDINLKNLKLYTMEEYKEFNGYTENIKDVNQYLYYVFPAIQSDDILLLKQDNGKNKILVSTGKPEICCGINEVKSLKSLFSKDKTLEIVVKSEAPLNKDVLCYVKKKGAYPVNNKDGICFDFICDIHVGINVMPKITVDKDEYVRVFLKDTEKYGSRYNIKQL